MIRGRGRQRLRQIGAQLCSGNLTESTKRYHPLAHTFIIRRWDGGWRAYPAIVNHGLLDQWVDLVFSL